MQGFTSASRFLEAFRPERESCLMLDVAMPELDGIHLQARLTHEGIVVPIVFLTGLGDIPMSVRAVKAGAVDFRTKPVNDADLLRAVRAALEVAAQRRTEPAATADLRARFASLTPRGREVMASP